MLATHPHPLSLPSSSPPTARHSLLSTSRPALADSTNINSRSNICGPGHSKELVYPTSSIRTGCGWSDLESSPGSIPTSWHSRQNVFSTARFPVTYKAPPTVSISLSAACSQNIPGGRVCGSRVQNLEPDLPDVRSVVPFPSAPLDGDTDTDMFDGTDVPCPDGHLLFPDQAPRKRRSAHSSVSSSQGSPGKDSSKKRPRKSRRHVAELWWLGVVHRSISRCIEVRQSNAELDASNRLLAGQYDFDATDRVLVERIQKRLVDNGCAEGRALPNPLPRIPSPSISVPSLVFLAPSNKTSPSESVPFTLSTERNPRESGALDGTTTSPVSKMTCITLSNNPQIPTPSSGSTSHRRHVHFEVPPRSRQAQPHPSIHRRSFSPPARAGTISTNGQLLTLTMPQLVASLTLAYHDRSGLRLRGRTYRITACEDNAGHSLPPVSCPAMQCSVGEAIQDKEGLHQPFAPRARLSRTPERKSPLSRVAYAES